jgi:ribosomal protein S27AE
MSTTGDDRDDAPDGVRILANNNNAPPAQDPPCALARLLAHADPVGEAMPMLALAAVLGQNDVAPLLAQLVPNDDAAVFADLVLLPARRVPRLGLGLRPLFARPLAIDLRNILLQPDVDAVAFADVDGNANADDARLQELIQMLMQAAGPDPFAEPILTLHQVRAMVFTPAELYPLWERAAAVQIEMGIQGVKTNHENCERCGTGIFNMEIRRRLILSGELRHGTISKEDAAPLSIPTVEENEAAKKDIKCSICLHDFEKKKDLISKTNCGHYYHIECISQWTKIQRKCPNCVRKLV